MPCMLGEFTEHLQLQCPDRAVSATLDEGVECQPGQRAKRRRTTTPMRFLNGRNGVRILEREGTSLPRSGFSGPSSSVGASPRRLWVLR